VRAGAFAALPGTALAFAFRGTPGALAALIALGLVVANVAVSGLVLLVAARRSPENYPMIALPSYALRMGGVFAVMGAVYAGGSIDQPTFTVTFALGLVGILAYECFLWARTPWLALEFAKERT
jgi:hypothetical protein